MVEHFPKSLQARKKYHHHPIEVATKSSDAILNEAKEEWIRWIEKQYKDIEKGMMSGSSKEASNSPEALTKIQQRKSAVIEDNSVSQQTSRTTV